ncbi:hypothetical protein F2Q69_00034476 [Brassica cretica]|uniref:Uncharacterized protein n=1 Tax=Brassica cretica TaxID=69181 RepID=A0A8S9SJR2_BRACR|nr:hypothetical protein F2Q69_00034476 [Brassica cretica]
MVSQIVWLGVRDVFTQIAKDVVGQGLDHGQDLGLLLVLEGAMTNSTYVSRFSFILIPYRFKVRDSAIILVPDVRKSSLRDG